MTPDIHVASLRNGDHICFFYRDAEEELSTAVPFIQVGLLRGERCLCVLQLQHLVDAHRLALTSSSCNRRAIRIRNGNALGDVIFDRESARLFHYTVQETGNKELLNLGQESSLTAAMDAVETALRSLKRADA